MLKNNKETYLTKVKNDEKFTFYLKKYPSLFKKGLNPKVGYKIACDHLGFNYLRPKEELKNY